MRRRGVIRRLGGLCLLLWLSGCVTTPPGPESRELTLAAEADRVLHAGLAVLVAQGYVIRHGDAELRRLEAERGDWPGYRLRLTVTEAGTEAGTDIEREAASRITLLGWRGGRPLAPLALDPLLVAIQAELGLLP
ncbi:hypothetical protein IHD13_09725 [Halomonas sp. 328]|nr:hypothetical protein [Halomonas sp. 328]